MITRYAVGQAVDERYEVLTTLGQGGMGETYQARDRATGQIVVVKVPYAHLIGDPAVFSRYQREMAVGKRLQHPNIQRLVAEGHPGRGVAPYMVFEYVDGQGLREYLALHAPLAEAEALAIAGQLAAALDYCHGQAVVHRDLKPENVLITPGGQVTLVDFGIALLRGARRLTFGPLSNTVGTPDYMSPEQVRGERGDARTDVYALGVMLYEMLVGKVPYPGDNALVVLNRRVTTDPPLVRRMRPDVSPPVEAVIYRALRRDPAERYASMAALRHDLDHLDEVAIPDYTPDWARPPTVGPMPSAKAAIVAVCVVFGILAALGILAELAHRGQLGR